MTTATDTRRLSCLPVALLDRCLWSWLGGLHGRCFCSAYQCLKVPLQLSAPDAHRSARDWRLACLEVLSTCTTMKGSFGISVHTAGVGQPERLPGLVGTGCCWKQGRTRSYPWKCS